MRDGEDLAGTEEANVVDGGVVVEGLNDGLVLVSNSGVVDVDETVCRPGKE